MVIAVGLNKQQEALKMQSQVSETTNKLLMKNSELIKSNTIGVAKESEKGIVEIETLKKVNEDLISTISETIQIQKKKVDKRGFKLKHSLGNLKINLRNHFLKV